jgi:argininosuccinate lyase
MIESWLQSTGIALPRLITARGHRYVLVTRDPAIYPPGHPVLEYADDVLTVETNDTGPLVGAVRQYAGLNRVGGVLTTCDYYLEAAAECASALGLPGPPPHVMHAATRKHLVRAATRRAGLATPRYAVAETWEAARVAAARLEYPLVAKPVDLNSGTSVRLVDDEAELKDAYSDITSVTHNTRGQRLCRQILIEEYLSGPEVSVESVTVNGVTKVVGITEKRVDPSTLVETAHRFPAPPRRDQADAITAYVREVLHALGFVHGVSHTELKLTTDGPRLVEINPRQAGGHIFDLVKLVTGTDLLGLLIDLALGYAPQIATAAVPLGDSQRALSAAVAFVSPPLTDAEIRRAGPLLDADPSVTAWELTPSPLTRAPWDNNERAGHVIAVDGFGGDALERARRAIRTALPRARLSG